MLVIMMAWSVGRYTFLVASTCTWNDRRHLSTISVHLQKTTKTASV